MVRGRWLAGCVGLAGALSVLLAERAALAQSNYGSTPLGGRSALMGNTGVALAKDGSAPFLNPATIVRIDDAKFAFSVNMYSASVSSYSNWHAPGPLDQKRYGTLAQDQTSETQGRLDALPSTLCFFFTLRGLGQTIGEDEPIPEGTTHRKGRQKLAACLGTTDRGAADYPALNFHSAGNTVSQAQSFTRNWSRFQVGPTWSTYLTDDLAVGISFHGAYTQYEAYLSSSNIGTDTDGHPTVASYSASANAHALDLAAIIGMTYRLGRGTHLGVSLQTRAGSIFGSYSANEFQSYQGAGQVSLARGDFAAPVPYRLSVGLGEEWERVRVETNVSVYAPSNPSLSANIHADDTITDGNTVHLRPRDFTVGLNANTVVNSAMGFEYSVTRDLSVLGGLATDFSAGDRLTVVSLPALGTFTESRENRAIVSTGIASRGKTAEILFGFQLGYGWGKAYAVDSLVQPATLGVVDVHTYSAIAIIGGSADLRAIEDAVKGVQRAVVPKKK